MFTGYIKLKRSSFRPSDYSLRWIKMEEKMTNTNIYKNRWDYKKNKSKQEKI